MEVLRVIANGEITSFRYPHFVQGVHLTYEMPPPATIYGHVCSALGVLLPPDALRFAYHFQHEGKFFDYEHLHFYSKRKHTMNPFRREQLFRPRLTLYLAVARPDVISLDELARAFSSPEYAVVLGRSQDLLVYSDVQIITLQEDGQAYFDGTLLPLPDAALIGGRFYAVTMPRYIDENRQPQWAQYAVLPHSNKPPILGEMQPEGQEAVAWVDEDYFHPFNADIKRGVLWHDWV